MKLFVCVCVVAALSAVVAMPQNKKFHDLDVQAVRTNFKMFLANHGKVYTEQEFATRMEIFHANLAKIDELNDQDPTGVYGITQFADLTEAEFRSLYLTLDAHSFPQGLTALTAPPALKTPDSWDWRDKGAVTDVKDQGQCGSCWAFSTTGNLEGLNYVKNNKLIPLSEQQLVDCDHLDSGCSGGLPSNAYQYVEENGIESEEDYPYTARDENCKADPSKSVLRLTGWKQLPTDEGDLSTWVAGNWPASIGINATPLQFYTGGIADPSSCNPQQLNHGVLIVGYGTEAGKDFWIVKNSWGGAWGEQGYFRIIRGKGACGLNTMATTGLM
eukprot:TRINITY_DN4297_c3_g1_i1.p1 TRINITY_DN4297_c3_g1~~TRINITY_DN4297_c3_g1_i1.p1  ORF type:complete len:329 (+),score=90.29 TRINITY_DN4297_c3_g1_i1:109-1095(+)